MVRAAEPLVAGPAEDDGVVFAGRVGDGGGAGLGGEWSAVGKRARSSPSSARIWAALTAPLRGRLCTSGPSGCWASAAAMAAESCWIWVDERGEDGDERADELAAGLALGLAGVARGGACGGGRAVRRRGAGRSTRGGEELGQAVFAQALGALGGGIAGEEGQGDGRVDVGEDGGGAGPEALEQGAELIGEGDAVGDEVVAAADEGAQRAGLVRGRPSAAGSDGHRCAAGRRGEGVAGITLAAAAE